MTRLAVWCGAFLACVGLGCLAWMPSPPGPPGRLAMTAWPAHVRPAGPDVAAGALRWRVGCAICHGEAGQADGAAAGEPARRVPVLRAGGEVSEWLARLRAAGHVDAPHADLAAFLADGWQPRPRERLRLSGADRPGCDGCHDRDGETIIAEVGCGACHGGAEDRFAPDLTGIGSRLRPAFLRRFLTAPYNRRQHGHPTGRMTRMPDFGLDPQQVADLAAYLGASRVALPAAPSGGDVARGAALVADRGCHDCHRIGKRGGRIGPDLTGVGLRVRPEWLAAWLDDPASLAPGTAMPDPRLDAGERRDVAAYLLSLRAVSIEDHLGQGGPRGRVGEGMRWFVELGCASCHPMAGVAPRAVATSVSLDVVGLRRTRDWLYDRLDERGRMPRFRLTAPERLAVVDALERRARAAHPSLGAPVVGGDAARGRAVYAARKCGSCHEAEAARLPSSSLRVGFAWQALRDPGRWLRGAHPRLSDGEAADVARYVGR